MSTGVRTSFQWVCTTLGRESAGSSKDKETVWTVVCGDDHTTIDQVRPPVLLHALLSEQLMRVRCDRGGGRGRPSVSPSRRCW